jgi:hypothetical protein
VSAAVLPAPCGASATPSSGHSVGGIAIPATFFSRVGYSTVAGWTARQSGSPGTASGAGGRDNGDSCASGPEPTGLHGKSVSGNGPGDELRETADVRASLQRSRDSRRHAYPGDPRPRLVLPTTAAASSSRTPARRQSRSRLDKRLPVSPPTTRNRSVTTSVPSWITGAKPRYAVTSGLVNSSSCAARQAAASAYPRPSA